MEIVGWIIVFGLLFELLTVPLRLLAANVRRFLR